MDQSFTISRYADGKVTLVLQPQAPVGGLDIVFECAKRDGGPVIFSKYVSSGYNGASGLTITNSGAGIIDIRISAPNDLSGQDQGNFHYKTLVTTSGRDNRLSEGFISLT